MRHLAVGARIVIFPGHLVHFAMSDPLQFGDREDFEIRHSTGGNWVFVLVVLGVWYGIWVGYLGYPELLFTGATRLARLGGAAPAEPHRAPADDIAPIEKVFRP